MNKMMSSIKFMITHIKAPTIFLISNGINIRIQSTMLLPLYLFIMHPIHFLPLQINIYPYIYSDILSTTANKEKTKIKTVAKPFCDNVPIHICPITYPNPDKYTIGEIFILSFSSLFNRLKNFSFQ